MTSLPRAFAILLCISLSGCYAKLHGVEMSAGGTATTTTSGQVSGSARLSGGSASFSSGQRVSPGASGGQVSLGKAASGVLIVGLVLADWINTIAGTPQPRPLRADERIMETCSCYQKPAKGDEQ
jgi:hypothetical protein